MSTVNIEMSPMDSSRIPFIDTNNTTLDSLQIPFIDSSNTTTVAIDLKVSQVEKKSIKDDRVNVDLSKSDISCILPKPVADFCKNSAISMRCLQMLFLVVIMSSTSHAMAYAPNSFIWLLALASVSLALALFLLFCKLNRINFKYELVIDFILIGVTISIIIFSFTFIYHLSTLGNLNDNYKNSSFKFNTTETSNNGIKILTKRLLTTTKEMSNASNLFENQEKVFEELEENELIEDSEKLYVMKNNSLSSNLKYFHIYAGLISGQKDRLRIDGLKQVLLISQLETEKFDLKFVELIRQIILTVNIMMILINFFSGLFIFCTVVPIIKLLF